MTHELQDFADSVVEWLAFKACVPSSILSRVIRNTWKMVFIAAFAKRSASKCSAKGEMQSEIKNVSRW